MSTGVVDDSEAILDLERKIWTVNSCMQTTFLTLTTPPPPPSSYACILPYLRVHCLMVNYSLLSPCHYSYITTHHIIIHSSSHIIPCHITPLITSCHTIYFITPTPMHTQYSQPLKKTAANCRNVRFSDSSWLVIGTKLKPSMDIQCDMLTTQCTLPFRHPSLRASIAGTTTSSLHLPPKKNQQHQSQEEW